MSMRIEISDHQTGKTANIAMQMQFDRDINEGNYFILVFRNKKAADHFKKQYRKLINRLIDDDCTVKFIYSLHEFDRELFNLSEWGPKFDVPHTFTYFDDIETNKWFRHYYICYIIPLQTRMTDVFYYLLENAHVSASTTCDVIRDLVHHFKEENDTLCDIVYLSTVLKDPRRIL